MALDLNFVRSQFPAFSVHGLKDQAFFENAGGSYACAPVIDRLTRFYRERKVQPYAPYGAAQAGGAEMDEARARLAAMMGVGPDEVSFGPSTTANTYVLAQAMGSDMETSRAMTPEKRRIKAALDSWIANGILAEVDEDDPRHVGRKIKFVRPAKMAA